MPRGRQRSMAVDRHSMKTRATFLVGCMAGCLLSSAFYIWWSGRLLTGTGRYHVAGAANAYLQPSAGLFSRSADRAWTLASELRNKKRLLVVVLTSRTRVNTTLATLQKTWASPSLASYDSGVDYAVFVAGEGPSIPRVYWLRHMHDISWGNEGNMRQLFHVLHYLQSSFIRHYHWFLLASENTYIALKDIEEMLGRLDPSKLVYMGSLASEDPNVMAMLHLLPNEYFCEWGPGIVLSNAALVSIAEHLDSCRRLSASFGSSGTSRQNLQLGRGDVELGRCFSRRVGIQCTSSHEAKSYFVSDPDSYSRSPDRLWYSSQFQNLLTLHPVRDLQHMLAIHQFVMTRSLQRQRERLAVTQNQTNQICKQVSPDFAAPLTEPDAHYCRMRAFNDCQPSSPLGLEAVRDEFPPSFRAMNRYEVVAWSFMTPKGVYQSTTIVPVYGVSGELGEEINFIIDKVISTVNLREATEWVLWRFISCHFMYGGTRGREYILDVILEDKSDKSRKRRRWRVLRPHAPGLVLNEDNGEEVLTETVNIIVPLSKVGDRFHEFLKNYERQVLRENQNAALILVVFGSEVETVNRTMSLYQASHPDADITVVAGEGAFTRSVGLDTGMAHIDDSELAFLCDVDMSFDASFLDRCRLSTIQGSRVYYPEFFKHYDMNYVYKFKRKPAEIGIKREHGHWASYSYGMACMYKSDYLASGGFDTGITGWGGEDVNLFERVLKTGVDILKAPDPSLRHRYHEKMCSLSLSREQFTTCISSRNEGLADRMQLAEYVYHLEDRCGIKDRPLWS